MKVYEKLRRIPMFERCDRMSEVERVSLLATVALGEMWGVSSGNYYQLQPWIPALMIVGMFAVWMVLRSMRDAAVFTLMYIICVGIMDRAVRMPFSGSDVLTATKEAIQTLLSGHNPYLHTLITTSPPGSPFPYLPGELLFYGVPYSLHYSINDIEKGAGIAIIFLLAALGPIVGVARAALCVALYAVFSTSSDMAVAGSNDVGLAFILLASIILLAWSEFLDTAGDNARLLSQRVSTMCFYASAVFLAWALLFKAISWPFFPFIVAYLFAKNRSMVRRYVLTTVSICVIAVVPFLIPSPSGFFVNVYNGFVFHNGVLWGLNVWMGLRSAGLSIDPHGVIIKLTDNIFVIFVFLACLCYQSTSLSSAVMRGTATLMVALLLSQYTAAPYLVVAATMFIAAVALQPRTVLLGQVEPRT